MLGLTLLAATGELDRPSSNRRDLAGYQCTYTFNSNPALLKFNFPVFHPSPYTCSMSSVVVVGTLHFHSHNLHDYVNVSITRTDRSSRNRRHHHRDRSIREPHLFPRRISLPENRRRQIQARLGPAQRNTRPYTDSQHRRDHCGNTVRVDSSRLPLRARR